MQFAFALSRPKWLRLGLRSSGVGLSLRCIFPSGLEIGSQAVLLTERFVLHRWHLCLVELFAHVVGMPQ